jgi:hypothetical protein
MIKSLRKRHREVWTIWAILLPTFIVLGWLVIPNSSPVKLLDQQLTPLPVVISSMSNNSHDISIRGNQEKTLLQLEWINKTPLTVPTAVIYRLTDSTLDITRDELIGRIEARGNYIFPLRVNSLKDSLTRFTLYDFIHGKPIEHIVLKH